MVSVLAHLALLGAFSGQQVSKGQSGAIAQISTSLRLREIQTETPPVVPPTPEPTAQAPVPVDAQANEEPEPSDQIASPSQVAAQQAGLDAIVGAYYFPSDKLTAKPTFLRDTGGPGPMFIPDVMPLPVIAHIYISEQGKVDSVVLNDNFLSDIARQYIEASFASMEFTPGLMGTLPVKSELAIEVKLDPTLPVR